jgi:hypothetical protein
MDYFSNIANEMGLHTNKQIAEIKPGDKNLDIRGIIVCQISKNTLKNEQKIRQLLLADSTGSIHCNFFDEVGEKLNEGDVIFLKNAYASVFKNNLILYANKPGYGQVVKVGEYFMTYNEQPNLSIASWRKIIDEKSALISYVLEG